MSRPRAIVTGGSRGIGRAIAQTLAGMGYDLALTFTSRRDEAEAAAQELRELGARAQSFQLELSQPDTFASVTEEALDFLGGLDAFIANAGVDFRGASVVATPYDELLQHMTINALSAHALCRLLLPSLRETGIAKGAAHIVFLSSVATAMRGPDYAPYVMSKLALEGLASVLAQEERCYGLRINTVAPGLTDTDMGKRFIGSDVPGPVRDRIIAGQAYGHVCTPAEIADVVGFLVSPAARYVNGQRIYVDGGGPQL